MYLEAWAPEGREGRSYRNCPATKGRNDPTLIFQNKFIFKIKLLNDFAATATDVNQCENVTTKGGHFLSLFFVSRMFLFTI